ncbi:F-box/FBD/LRR-repeat protein At1g13570-like [Chenopodium quinoa]|uniref:F-box/FBD/LRR-repeat protein At1g13570-like n=2 Tax=Chenopodium quinoa TaxID=63459 RepID=UPI000B7863F1|nr:F-box/FBD/LRR-repeat protein At1g13570-like [Chenopodium quinoa]
MADSSVLGHPLFRNLKRFKKIEEKDRISDLPDELLSNIVARLTLKEAITTSILSKRWADVWVSYPILDFGFLKKTYYTEILVHRVNKVLEKFNGGKLHKFRIVHPMSERFKSHIDEWISFATRNRVSELELDFGGWPRHEGFDDYHVPLHVFAREEMMILNRSSPNVRSFVSLRDLRLRSVNLSDQVFDIILYNCSSLENFHLRFNRGLVNAKNTAPHLKLKSLKLHDCFDLNKLELLAPNLVSFMYEGGYKVRLCIKDAPQLASLCLSVETGLKSDMHPIFPRGKNFIFNQFSSYLPKLESMVVSVALFEDMSNFMELCVFSNLKTLALDANSSSIRLCCQVAAFIISAAPYLELLELHLSPTRASLKEMEALELPSMSPHKNLKEVKLSGFRADVYTIDFLAYLVECTDSLQKINLSAYATDRSGDELFVQNRLKWRADEAENCKICVQELRKILYTNVQLIFHD